MFGRLKSLFSKSADAPQRPQTPHAGAYLLPNQIAIVAFGRVPAGFYRECEPCIGIPLSASTERIGQAVLEALAAFRASYSAPADKAGQRKIRLRALGVASERQLQQQALYCWFSRGPQAFEFEPTHNGGTAGETKGFQPNASRFSLPLPCSTAELGAALRRAFSLCTTVYERPANA